MIEVTKLSDLKAAAIGAQRLRTLALRAGSPSIAGLFKGAMHEALAVIGAFGQEAPFIPPVPLVSVAVDPATRVIILTEVEAGAAIVRHTAARGGSDHCAFIIAMATDQARELRYSLEAALSTVVPIRPLH